MIEDRRKRPPNRRLDSWKEIAAFFGRDERTVKRWEKERGLPVLRLPGARGGVYAFTDDLAQWMEAPKADSSVSAGKKSGVRRLAAESGRPVGQVEHGSVAVLEQAETSEREAAHAGPNTSSKIHNAWFPRLSLALLLVAAAAVVVLQYEK